jgi:SAM-dependent methyltransferase
MGFPGAPRPDADGPDLASGTREHYEDAVLYDYEYRRRRQDVTFYRQLAKSHIGGSGTILELGCGTGRITTALLRDGHTVVGLDLSERMLARATARMARIGRAARERGSLVRGDMRDFAFATRFPLVISAFNSLEHLYTRHDLAACLARVREHLTDDGVFAFDVQLPDLAWLCRNPKRRWARTKFKHPTTGDRLIYSTNHDYDPVTQIVVIRLYYESAHVAVDSPAPQVVHLTQRKFFPAELEGLLDAAGFTIEHRYGDFHRKPLTGDAESQVLVCRKAPLPV